ncbi:GGDEF domain-containing protein [Bacillus sp. MRMR6]|nr:GGDEF domain-containing protein [Bacillus sp. MRMR6]
MINENSKEFAFYRTTLEKLVENAPVGFYVLEDGNYLYVNAYYADLVGYSKDDLINKHVTIHQIIHPEDCSFIEHDLDKLNINEQIETNYNIRKIHNKGQIIYTQTHVIIANHNGKITSFGTVMDITKQKLVKQQLEDGSERYKSLFLYSPDAIFTFNREGKFVSANPASEEIIGYTTSELLEMSFIPLIHPEHVENALKHFEMALNGQTSSYHLIVTRKDGVLIHLRITAFPMRENGEIVGCYGTARDITQKILYDQQMEQLAFYDPLTQLPNRKLFEDNVDQLIHTRSSNTQPFAVLFLDLDRFKAINDSLGHHIGDVFLKLVSERLKNNLRKKDIISRLAGDEFTILLPKTDQEKVIQIAKRINKIMMDPFNVSGHSVTVSVSIGIAFGGNKEETVHQLIQQADTAMYYTKKYKKNSYTIYSKELDIKSAYKLKIERDLKQALEKKEFSLEYQPIFDMQTGEVSVFETLIRWNHKELGLIPPSDFIPIAEESGQIIQIGAWVLESACKQLKTWQNAGLPPFKVAVNISTKQLLHYDFVESVRQILKRTNLDPNWLELEITESFLVDDVELVKESLLNLKQAELSISIDDFGTGYTSLTYLRQFPLDKVKIDRSFIKDINRDYNGERITAAIISLAHSLNMTVVAEGIEEEDQLQFLKCEGCDEGQGYYLSHPLPVNLVKEIFLNQSNLK